MCPMWLSALSKANKRMKIKPTRSMIHDRAGVFWRKFLIEFDRIRGRYRKR